MLISILRKVRKTGRVSYLPFFMLVQKKWSLKFINMLISVKTSKKMPNNFPKGISVTRLAKLLGVSQCMLSQMANDKIVISKEKYEKIQEKLKNLNLL